MSSCRRRISDIKSPSALVLEIPPPLSVPEAFPNSPSAITHNNNSYTNLPAIPEFPAQNPMTETGGSDGVHHVCPMSQIMPIIPENLAGAGGRTEEVLMTVG
jgi:hypothetical protein